MSRIIPFEEQDFIRKHFRELTNQEMADHLGIKYGTVGTRLHIMGLKRGKTDEAVIKARANSAVPTPEAQQKGRDKVNSKKRKDLLSECFSESELRQFYAKYLYGQTINFPIEAVPRQVRKDAGMSDFAPSKCLNEIVEELALHWACFNSK
jgi:hypothetical protein